MNDYVDSTTKLSTGADCIWDTSNCTITTSGGTSPYLSIVPPNTCPTCGHFFYQWITPCYDYNKEGELETRIEELEEMLELLEEETGSEVVETPRFKVVKKKEKK